MRIATTSLPDVLLIEPARMRDERGWFSETWNMAKLRTAGIDIGFVQDNHSFSAGKGTLRGLHFQRPPHAQDKLVYCTRGAIIDVAVDVRKGSPAYGAWLGVELSAENGRQLLIPKGFLHGFATLTDNVEVHYKCSDVYAPECDGAVRWDSVGIDWGVSRPLLSPKDAGALSLSQFDSPFTYGGCI